MYALLSLLSVLYFAKRQRSKIFRGILKLHNFMNNKKIKYEFINVCRRRNLEGAQSHLWAQLYINLEALLSMFIMCVELAWKASFNLVRREKIHDLML